MALDRVELIARGLLRAQELSGHHTPIVSLLDNDQLKSLSPEERVEVIKRYSRLKGQNSEYDGPSAASTIWGSAKTGMALAFPLALLGGKLTAPTLKVLKKAKTYKAWKNIGIKTGTPLLATAAAGAVVGATAGMLQHSATSGTNRYLNQISNQIAASTSEEEADVNAAALMASTPYMAKGFMASQGMGHHYTMANLPGAVNNLTTAANSAAHNYDGKIERIPDWARRRYQVPATKEYIGRLQQANVPGSQGMHPQATEDRQVYLPLSDPGNRWNYVKGIGWTKND